MLDSLRPSGCFPQKPPAAASRLQQGGFPFLVLLSFAFLRISGVVPQG